MGTTLARVNRWVADLRGLDVADLCPHLSAEGARAGLDAALDALRPALLDRAVDRPGTPFPRAAMVVARTVFTAPIEWAAVLLARGTALTLKPASGDHGFARALAHTARAHGLRLDVTDDRDVVTEVPLVVAMGSDETVEAIRRRVRPDARYLGFGHRFGAAYLTTDAGFAALGDDLALHDGLGCMSPASIFTDWPVAHAVDRLAEVWSEVDARLPGGPRSPAEGARVREREALARVLGRVARGGGWSVHALPVDRFVPAALPRSVAVHAVGGRDEVERLLERHRDALSTFGTDDPALVVPPTARRCAPGEMQRPPLDRLHDGVDWLSETMQP